MTFPVRMSVGWCRYAPARRDVHGRDVAAWEPAVRLDAYGVAPAGSREPRTVGENRVVEELELLVPSVAGVGPQDRILIDGVAYQVVGVPADYDRGPFGWRPGGVIRLMRVEG